jgi:hypothetical protein
MAFNINNIKSNLQFGGARPSQFEVILVAPLAAPLVSALKLRFTCKATTVPVENLGQVSVPYFGRVVKFAGERTYDDWSITVINDEDCVVRTGMEQWMDAINQSAANVRNAGATSSPNSYKGNATVIHYGKQGNVIQTYSLEGCFPTSLSAIDLNWETANAIEEFTVTLAYDRHVRGTAL